MIEDDNVKISSNVMELNMLIGILVILILSAIGNEMFCNLRSKVSLEYALLLSQSQGDDLFWMHGYFHAVFHKTLFGPL